MANVRRLRAALVVIAAVVVVAACGSSTKSASKGPSGASTPMAITVALPWTGPPPICCMIPQAAQALGYFAQENLTVHFAGFAGSALPIQDLVAGRADLAGAYIGSGLGAVASGANLRLLGSFLNSSVQREQAGGVNNQYIGGPYGATKDIKGPCDLKGKTIGLSNGTNPTDPNYVIALAFLKSCNLSSSSVKWAVLGTQSLRDQALVAGRIQFTSASFTDADLINKASCCHMIVLPPPASTWQGGWNNATSWFASASTVSNPSKAEAIQRFITATMKAARCMDSSESCFDKVATGFFPAYGNLSAASKKLAWEVTRQTYPPNGGLPLQDLQAWFNGEYLKLINPSGAGKIDLTTVVDPQFVSAAMAQLGVDKSIPSDPPQTSFK
jgi:ABC-type nitrate/sulfonate/bicarbonate transport system substrate-binding protein